jgi:hypothetical protein
LHNEIKHFYEAMSATPEEKSARQDVVNRITEVVHSLWSGAKVTSVLFFIGIILHFKYCAGFRRRNHITPILNLLHWLAEAILLNGRVGVSIPFIALYHLDSLMTVVGIFSTPSAQ